MAFTICPDYSVAYKDDLLRKYGSSKLVYQRGNYNHSKNVNKSYRAVYAEVVHSLEELLTKVELSTWHEEVAMVDIPVNGSLDPTLAKWSKKWHALYGVCYSLELLPKVTSYGISELYLESPTDIYIFLHYPGQFLDYDTNSKLFGKLGNYLFIDVSYEVSIDTLESGSKMICSHTMNDHLDDCLLEGIHRNLTGTFGCTIPYLGSFSGNATICDPMSSGVAAIATYNSLRNIGQRHLCDKPCSSIDIYSGMPFVSEDARMKDFRMKMYLKTSTKVKNTVEDYPLITMVAEIGGYTGLLLGISFVHLTALVDKLWEKIAFV